MTDPRVQRMAKLLVGYSAGIVPGDQVLIEACPPAEPLVLALIEEILKAGGHPHLLLSFDGVDLMTGSDTVFLSHANDEQLANAPRFMLDAYHNFESRIRVHSASNTKAKSAFPPGIIAKRGAAIKEVTATQFDRGQDDTFRWVTTLFPTAAYAQEAEMSLDEYESFVFSANHVQDEADPVAIWKGIEKAQSRAIQALSGAEWIEVKGPNADLKLSVKGRKFINACGKHNMPDGEVFTGPVEDSAEGWVRFTYPAIYQGNSVSGIELKFEKGRVAHASAEKGEQLMQTVIDADEASRYLGEFAIGLNTNINRFTGNILFDEKIGGSFHMALGAGYPETGSKNKSAIHWDMICDLRQDSEILVDGELFYKNGSILV